MGGVIEDFNRTLKSIINSTDPNFEIFVACHEIPPIDDKLKNDNRLHFIVVDFPIPRKWIQYCRDRALKLMTCTMRIREDFDRYAQEDGGVFVFPVDADDLISNRVVEFVNSHPLANGFKSDKGFVWKKGKHIMQRSPYFGGTMNIMKMFKSELPEFLPERNTFYNDDTGKFLMEQYKICWDDHEVEGKYRDEGRPFTRLPFESTVYVIGTGENISKLDPRKAAGKGRLERITGIHFHPVAFLRKINPFDKVFITKRIKDEFWGE